MTVEPSSSEIEGQRQQAVRMVPDLLQPSSSEIEGQRQLGWWLEMGKWQPSSSEIESQRQQPSGGTREAVEPSSSEVENQQLLSLKRKEQRSELKPQAQIRWRAGWWVSMPNTQKTV